jgi:hypothetical protein
MTPKKTIEGVLDTNFENEDGNMYKVELQPGLSESELSDFESRFLKPLPVEIKELLIFCRGFEFGPVDTVDFTGKHAFEFESLFPQGVPIASDGFGNFWIVDINPESGTWAPIFYACHDPPVVVYQSPTLSDFLTKLLKLDRNRRDEEKNSIDEVREKCSHQIWRQNSGLISFTAARDSNDKVLTMFAEELDDRFEIVDLRNGEIGAGFSWGRAGPETEVRRYGSELVFAIKKKKTLLGRIFGR